MHRWFESHQQNFAREVSRPRNPVPETRTISNTNHTEIWHQSYEFLSQWYLSTKPRHHGFFPGEESGNLVLNIPTRNSQNYKIDDTWIYKNILSKSKTWKKHQAILADSFYSYFNLMPPISRKSGIYRKRSTSGSSFGQGQSPPEIQREGNQNENIRNQISRKQDSEINWKLCSHPLIDGKNNLEQVLSRISTKIRNRFQTWENDIRWLQDFEFFQNFLKLEMRDSPKLEHFENSLIHSFAEKLGYNQKSGSKTPLRENLPNSSELKKSQKFWIGSIEKLEKLEGEEEPTLFKINEREADSICFFEKKFIETLFNSLFPFLMQTINSTTWTEVVMICIQKSEINRVKIVKFLKENLGHVIKNGNAQNYFRKLLKIGDDLPQIRELKAHSFKFINENHIQLGGSLAFTKFCNFLINNVETEELKKLYPLIKYLKKNPEICLSKMLSKRVYILLIEKLEDRQAIGHIYKYFKKNLLKLMVSKDANSLIRIFLKHQVGDAEAEVQKVMFKNFEKVVGVRNSFYFMTQIMEGKEGKVVKKRFFDRLRSINT